MVSQKPSTSNDSFFVRPTIAQKIPQERFEKQQKSSETFFKKSKNKREPTQPKKQVFQQQQSNDNSVKPEKKPFNKKQWRLQRYSKKFKVEEWENKRKKVIERRYNRELKHQPTFDVKKIYEEEGKQENEEDETDEGQVKNKKRRMNYGEVIQKIKKDKLSAKEEAERRMEERKVKLEASKKKRMEKSRIFSQRTRKGQPIMKGRLELLYKQIEESCSKN